MKTTLIASGDGVAALTDTWRIPREQVQPMRDGLAMLRESDRRLARAMADAETQKARAQADGFEAGRAAGLRQAAGEAAEALATLTAKTEQERAAMRDSVGHLALEVVRRIAGDLDPSVLTPAMIERAVREVLPDQPMRVRIAPGAAAAVETRLWAINAAIEVVVDDQLRPLDCVLETENGRVQAGLEDQLGVLARAFGARRSDGA